VFTVDPRLLGLDAASCGARVLDVGCGAGRHELALAALPLRVIACDLDRKSLNDGRFFVLEDAKRAPHPGAVAWVQADGSRLPFRNASFDALVCSETLEHVTDDLAVLGELRRVGRAGATLAVSVPAYLVEFLLWQISWDVTHTPGGHLRLYHKAQLLDALRAAGWRPYAVRYRHAFESVYWLLGTLGGGGTPPNRVARWWRRLLDRPAIDRSRLFDCAERLLARPLGKSLVVYARAV
jgi:ubiquinone/menaquinone biosynthesis C-methylase UbiE